LVTLFYAEEDLRGWYTWNRFRHAWEAKGEHFSLASLVPPPVPDEENFALTPIVFTSYGQVMTREGKPIPEEKRDDQFVVRMRMPVTLDYPGPTNCAGDRVKGTLTRLDCWQSHYRELAARTNVFPIPAQPQSPAADVLLALSKYDGVIEELRAACRLPYSRYPINYDSDSPWAIMLPHLAVLKSCAQVLQLRSLAHLQNGKPDKALEDVQLALQLTDKVHTEPILISHLVRMAMVQLMLQPIWEGLAERKWSDAQLAALEAELAKLDFCADYKLGMHCELGFQSDIFRLLGRHPGKLKELEGLVDLSGNKPGLGLPSGFFAYLIPAGWFYQNQYRCARVMEDYQIPLADVSQGTFSPALARRGEAAVTAETKTASPFNRFERLLLPSLNNAARRFAYGQASLNLARTAIALERYRVARGAFPESLDALTPEFIAKVPHDVIGGQPLKYRREADGSYVLYSVGWDEEDDGGEAAFNQDGTVDVQHGDWVWRSAAKAE
jgi:tetratricopeptide (TPR) repeat protein